MATTAEVNFVKDIPDAKGRGRTSKFIALVDILKSKPGHWAEVKDAKAQNVTQLRKLGLEAVSRDGVVYARYPESES